MTHPKHPHVPPVPKPHPQPQNDGKPMASALLVSVKNHSKHRTESEVQKATAAVAMQLARDIAPIYGSVQGIEYVPPGATATADSSPCDIADTIDAPGAGGYHDEDENGVPYIKILASEDLGPVLSHENAEISQDAPANRWSDMGDGSSVAWELCDATESDTYEIGGVKVSNFVYPAWFDPKAGKGQKFDYLDLLKAPFTMTPGGYMIVRTEPGKVSDVFAKHVERHPGCDVREVPGHPALHLVFGRDYPEHKKLGKIIKAARRRGKK